jgi:hypothetical protein
MTGVEALASLGLEPGADWPDIKNAYRSQIRSHHPDLSHAPGDQAVAAQINIAYALLADLADQGRLPAARPLNSPTPEPVGPALASAASDPAVLVVPPGDLFDRLLDAAHDVGDVTHIDPDAGTVQMLIRLTGWPPSQLTCQLAKRGGDQVILSTLESLDSRPAPPIADVVTILADQLRSR